ncbi:XXYS1_4_G0046540.mRNA.1.CDS.1 [Saccharomyces cerevisiae]|nr:XXYS1_4_G0046540.mRNA.1.CDS.1 [Saccharomyces cerevisiae]
METPTDNIVSPFHNFGSSTQYIGTLSRTPNQIIELEKPSTLSPLSRGKKWTEKLARFQRSSAKKKRFQRTSIKKSFLNASCTLCDEPISNRRKGEKIIELACGHLSHQECLIISFGTTSKADVRALFPFCTKCKKDTNKAVQCIPENDELKDILISDFLIHKIPDSELSITPQSRFPPYSPLLPPFGLSYTPVERQTIYSQAPSLNPNLILAAPPKERNQIPQKKSNYTFLHSPLGHRRIPSGANSILADTSVALSANDSISAVSNSVRAKDDETRITLPLLRSYFIQILLNNFQEELQDWRIDGDYGLLRLVDKLMISKDGQRYIQCWCFLFEDAFVIAEVDNDVDVLEIRLKNLEVFTPIANLRMTTLEASVLKCTLNKQHCANKVVEVANVHDNDTVIIRRGFTLSSGECSRQSTVDSIQSVLTTISSILSLKREKPDNLAIILQIDFTKLKEEDSLIVIYNSLKALTIKFARLQFCFVDRNNYVLDYGSVLHKIDSLDSISNLKSKSSSSQFSPIWLKNTLYPENIHEHLGIVAVSNSNMEAKKSILFQDYRCFTSFGRRRPNELKIKVGYLNVDYSDKIDELVEASSWNFVLETLCYSFGLSFDEDDDDDEEDNDDSTDNELDNSSGSLSDAESTTTIHIDSPFDSENATANMVNDRNLLTEGEHSNIENLEAVASSVQQTLIPNIRFSLYSDEEGTNENENENDMPVLLLSDMDKGIDGITRRSSFSSLIESGNNNCPLHMDYI